MLGVAVDEGVGVAAEVDILSVRSIGEWQTGTYALQVDDKRDVCRYRRMAIEDDCRYKSGAAGQGVVVDGEVESNYGRGIPDGS